VRTVPRRNGRRQPGRQRPTNAANAADDDDDADDIVQGHTWFDI
jgi:hypothetical protein